MKSPYRRGRRRRRVTPWVILLSVCLLIIMIGVIGICVSYASAHQTGTRPYAEPSGTNLPTYTATVPSASSTAVTRQCKAGWPTSFSYPDLGIKSPIEAVHMGRNAPDAPVSKTTIGVVKTGTLFDNATRPALPGEGYGNIIAEGHTYGDNSAVFKQDADTHAKIGQTFYFAMNNGSRCEYRVTAVWRQLAKAGVKPNHGQQTFTKVATKEGFYEPHPGHEQVLLMTCDSEIVNGHHTGELAMLAVPIN